MKKWSKKEFISIVNPCGYRIRIWLFFLTHRYVTLLDVVNARGVDIVMKIYCIRVLDKRFWSWMGRGEFEEYWQTLFDDIRMELESLAARK